MYNLTIGFILNFTNKDIGLIKRKIANLNNKELIELIKNIEKELQFAGDKCLEEGIFVIIAKSIKDRLDNSKKFVDYKQLKYNLERIKWLRKKNICKEYNNKEDDLFKEIISTNPEIKEKIIELIDLETERETKLIRCMNL